VGLGGGRNVGEKKKSGKIYQVRKRGWGNGNLTLTIKNQRERGGGLRRKMEIRMVVVGEKKTRGGHSIVPSSGKKVKVRSKKTVRPYMTSPFLT